MQDEGGAAQQWLTVRARVQLARRVAALRAQAAGAVLELGAGDDLGTLERRVAAGEHYDSVVSVLRLAALGDGRAAAVAVRRLLGPGGRFFFVEPTTAAGMTRRAQRLFAPVDHALTRRPPRIDLPATLRAAGLHVTDCTRFDLPMPWPWRTFVEGSAR